MKREKIKIDVLVLGSGGAGIRAAIAAHDMGSKVLIISKSDIGRAHTIEAEGGINAALGVVDPEDSPKIHAADTLTEGHNIASKTKVNILATEAPDRIKELAGWGMQFNRTKNGEIEQRWMAAHSYRRTNYAADRTGYELLQTLIRQAKKRAIDYRTGMIITNILTDGKKLIGVLAVNFKSGALVEFSAKALVICSGGYTRNYYRSSHIEEAYGDGVALAYTAGCELGDMEMVQFHPTGMVVPEKYAGTLVTEAMRGHGAYLLNEKKERFMNKYDAKRMELSARDVVARAIWTEVKEGRGTKNGGVFLDISHIDSDTITSKLSKMYDQFKNLSGIDITKEPVEVSPTAHYTMGGIRVTPEDGATCIEGVYAAGEVATGLHGANRLGGNSLIDIVVFGKRTGEAAANYSKEAPQQILSAALVGEVATWLNKPILNKKGKQKASVLKEKIRRVMDLHAGLIKSGPDLVAGLDKLIDIKQKSLEISVSGGLKENSEWLDWLEVQFMLICSEACVRSSIMRKESRGAHYRQDYPEESNEWNKNVVVSRKDDSMLVQKKAILD